MPPKKVAKKGTRKSGRPRQPPTQMRDDDGGDQPTSKRRRTESEAVSDSEIDPQTACTHLNNGSVARSETVGHRLADMLLGNNRLTERLVSLMEKVKAEEDIPVTTNIDNMNSASHTEVHDTITNTLSPADTASAATDSIINKLQGKQPRAKPNSALPCHSFKEPIGPHVSKDVKQDIWDHNFIDMSRLLQRKSDQAAGIQTHEQWTSAFIVYVAIYAQKFPSETPGLMKHMEIVRDLGSRGGRAWMLYDDNFRQYRAENPEALQWGDFLSETWSRASQAELSPKTFPRTRSKNQSFRAEDGTAIPKGFCFSYAKGRCNNDGCRFWHKCALCQKSHPTTTCNFKRKNTQNWGSKQRNFGSNQQQQSRQNFSRPNHSRSDR